MRSDTDRVADAAAVAARDVAAGDRAAPLAAVQDDGQAAAAFRAELAKLRGPAHEAEVGAIASQFDRYQRSGSPEALAGVQRSLERLSGDVHQEREQAVAAAASTASSSRLAILGVGLVALLLAGGVAFAMTRYVTRRAGAAGRPADPALVQLPDAARPGAGRDGRRRPHLPGGADHDSDP